MNTPDIPDDITIAAIQIATHFKKEGIDNWQLEGICSREYAYALEKMAKELGQEKIITAIQVENIKRLKASLDIL